MPFESLVKLGDKLCPMGVVVAAILSNRPGSSVGQLLSSVGEARGTTIPRIQRFGVFMHGPITLDSSRPLWQ